MNADCQQPAVPPVADDEPVPPNGRGGDGPAPAEAGQRGDEAAAMPAAPALSLPPAVRDRAVSLAAQAIANLPPDHVPASLRRVARFTPAKRARLAAAQLAAALATDHEFRERVAEGLRSSQPLLTAAVDAGEALPAAPVVEVAAVAYLLQPPGWSAYVGVAQAEATRAAADTESTPQADVVTELRDQLATARAQGRADVERVRRELAAARAGADDLRRALRHADAAGRRAGQVTAQAHERLQAERAAASAAASAAEAEARRLRARVAELEASAERSRRADRESRSAEDIRLRILLETLIGAASGLRRELGLAPTSARPADLVSPEGVGELPSPLAAATARGMSTDDPALLDVVLAIPGVHLLVDGYNVTKSAYGSAPLEAQRSRLVIGLSALAAQTGAEVTCVFDGAALDVPVATPAGRRVRVLFSPPGQTADELLRRLVRGEPPGRPVVVVSSDREVADGVRRAGAYPLPAAALARRLR